MSGQVSLAQRSHRGLALSALLLGCDPAATPTDANTPDAAVNSPEDAWVLDAMAFDARSPTPDASARDAFAHDAFFEGDAALPPIDERALRPGGETTSAAIDQGAYVQQAANLTLRRRADFEAGLQFFQLEWEVAPGRPEADGLGPTFNAVSCIACHARNGRGAPPRSATDNSPGVLIRLGAGDSASLVAYGDQLQPFGIPGVSGEGRARRIDDVAMHHTSAGELVSLIQPRYVFEALAFGTLDDDLRVSPRIAQQLVGQGLLESIANADILAWEDPSDADGNGISGRAHWQEGQLGRFGWKASQPTVESQTSAAFLGDLGITTPVHPDENCPGDQSACRGARTGGTPELSAARLRASAAYLRLLGVPARRDAETLEVRQGGVLFERVGCGDCHRAYFRTSDALEPELALQDVWPYTDLLLHDMGDGLADGRADGDATGREWRTPPLWGVGLLPVVNGQYDLLHDGRARSLREAILWHGGEAESARLAYERLSPEGAARLEAFVASL